MTIEQVVLENIRDLPTEKQQQVLDFVTFLKQQTTINLQSSSQGSRKSYKGMWADLGINIMMHNSDICIRKTLYFL